MTPETDTTVRLSTSDETNENIHNTRLDFQHGEKAEEILERLKDDNGQSRISTVALNASMGQCRYSPPDASVDTIRMRGNAEVRGQTTLSRSTIDRLMRANRFPQSVSISEGSVKFYYHEINEWLLSRPRSKNGLIMKGVKVKGPVQMLTIKDVTLRTGLSHSAIYRGMESGSFPASVQLTPGRTAWFEHELNAFLERLKTPPKSPPPPPVVTI